MNRPLTVAAAPAGRVLWRIAPFALIIFIGFLTVGMPLAALPLQVHDILGFGNLTVGVAIGVQSLVTLLTRPVAGTLCDRKGPRFGILAGAVGSLIAGAIYWLSTVPALPA